MANMLNMSVEPIQNIMIEDVDITEVCMKMVPRILNHDLKFNSINLHWS
jgi:hypothetical protein